MYYQDFLTKHPESKESWRWYIGTLLQVGRCDEAADAIKRLAALYKSDAKNDIPKGTVALRSDIYRAQLQWEQGKHEEALAAFEEITAKYPEEWLAWNCAGDAYAKACQYEKAIECYRRTMAVQEKPRYTDAAMAIAQICEITGDATGAVEAWKQYISILQEDWNTVEGVQIDRANGKIRELSGKR